MENLKIYVGTYAKYNNGSIAGEWLDLLNYENFDELKDICKVIYLERTKGISTSNLRENTINRF